MAVRHEIPGLIVTDREHSVPLDHADPDGARISVFTRELADPDGQERPLLVFFEGGPGSEAPRPSRRAGSPPWLERALIDFRVLMLDQRGTGRSTPVSPHMPGTPQEQAEYLAHFRADSIVADAESVRRELEVERWSVLGQSFGGFCALRYLSAAPEGLREVLFTGGVPPLHESIDEVYRATYTRMRERNRRFFERYPADRGRLLGLLDEVAGEPPRLPGGGALHPGRVRQLGNLLGMSDGMERLHYLLELDRRSPGFLHDVEAATSFARNPLYAILHEACWADGGATRWSAARIFAEQQEWPEEYMTGEHVFPWVFDDPAMEPMREAAELLAAREWPRLYDPERLANNTVVAAAAVYAEDPYVERSFSERTAAAVPGLKVWLTSEYDHDGLRKDGARVLGRLLDLARGQI
ncbi:MAG TPA: alpha/beta fold hydrolase [Solirubrobacteraceae bacterium]|jgi:pimeloyl-ACP methyl ester carboxylesterase|nr:alpha/beta fold hydrolase [Solirubrobacteraceae bacterium]